MTAHQHFFQTVVACTDINWTHNHACIRGWLWKFSKSISAKM